MIRVFGTKTFAARTFRCYSLAGLPAMVGYAVIAGRVYQVVPAGRAVAVKPAETVVCDEQSPMGIVFRTNRL